MTCGSAIPYESCACCHCLKGQDDALQWAWLHYTHQHTYAHDSTVNKQKNNARKHSAVINLTEQENGSDLKLFQNKDAHYENL